MIIRSTSFAYVALLGWATWGYTREAMPFGDKFPNLDGLGNKVGMLACANPEDRTDETKRSDGYGVVRFHKKTTKSPSNAGHASQM